jgi:small subunit ribosomal protein S1
MSPWARENTSMSEMTEMTESFADLFEESMQTIDMQSGSIISGLVVDIDSEWVTVHAGLKSEGVIPRIQFLDEAGNLEVAVGDTVQVAMEAVDDGFGETRLSREKAKRAERSGSHQRYH